MEPQPPLPLAQARVLSLLEEAQPLLEVLQLEDLEGSQGFQESSAAPALLELLLELPLFRPQAQLLLLMVGLLLLGALLGSQDHLTLAQLALALLVPLVLSHLALSHLVLSHQEVNHREDSHQVDSHPDLLLLVLALQALHHPEQPLQGAHPQAPSPQQPDSTKSSQLTPQSPMSNQPIPDQTTQPLTSQPVGTPMLQILPSLPLLPLRPSRAQPTGIPSLLMMLP